MVRADARGESSAAATVKRDRLTSPVRRRDMMEAVEDGVTGESQNFSRVACFPGLTS